MFGEKGWKNIWKPTKHFFLGYRFVWVFVGVVSHLTFFFCFFCRGVVLFVDIPANNDIYWIWFLKKHDLTIMWLLIFCWELHGGKVTSRHSGRQQTFSLGAIHRHRYLERANWWATAGLGNGEVNGFCLGRHTLRWNYGWRVLSNFCIIYIYIYLYICMIYIYIYIDYSWYDINYVCFWILWFIFLYSNTNQLLQFSKSMHFSGSCFVLHLGWSFMLQDLNES